MKEKIMIVSGGGTKLEDTSSWKEFIKQLDKELANIPVAKTDNYVCVSSDDLYSSAVGREILSRYKKESVDTPHS